MRSNADKSIFSNSALRYSLDNFKYKTLVCTKNCNDILFLFVCFSAG